MAQKRNTAKTAKADFTHSEDPIPTVLSQIENELLFSNAENIISSAEAQLLSAEVIMSNSESQIEHLVGVISSAEDVVSRLSSPSKPKDRVSKGK